MLFGEGHRIVHIGANTREPFKVGVDKRLRFGAWNPQISGQTKTRNPINYTKVNSFGFAAHFWSHLI